jgi:hydroxymethylpyrimidine pyrophosphatase-like HAD family hydrolase
MTEPWCDKAQGVSAPHNATKAAIGKLRANGYLAVLCTGRPLSYLPDNAEELPFDG